MRNLPVALGIKKSFGLFGAGALLAMSSRAWAAYTISFQQIGGDVVSTGARAALPPAIGL